MHICSISLALFSFSLDVKPAPDHCCHFPRSSRDFICSSRKRLTSSSSNSESLPDVKPLMGITQPDSRHAKSITVLTYSQATITKAFNLILTVNFAFSPTWMTNRDEKKRWSYHKALYYNLLMFGMCQRTCLVGKWNWDDKGSDAAAVATQFPLQKKMLQCWHFYFFFSWVKDMSDSLFFPPPWK